MTGWFPRFSCVFSISLSLARDSCSSYWATFLDTNFTICKMGIGNPHWQSYYKGLASKWVCGFCNLTGRQLGLEVHEMGSGPETNVFVKPIIPFSPFTPGVPGVPSEPGNPGMPGVPGIAGCPEQLLCACEASNRPSNSSSAGMLPLGLFIAVLVLLPPVGKRCGRSPPW